MPLAWFAEHACDLCAYIILYNKTHWLDLFVCVCVIKVTLYVLHVRRCGDIVCVIKVSEHTCYTQDACLGV